MSQEVDEASPARRREVTFEGTRVHLVTLGLVAGAGVGELGSFALVHGTGALADAFDTVLQPGIFVPGLLAATILHEGLHALGWMCGGGLRLRSIKFGIQWRTLMPSAHARVPIRASASRVGAALPGVVLGVLPAVVAVCIGDGALAVWAWVLTSVASGDALVVWALRHVPGHELVEDHPSRIGCLVIEREGG